MSKNKWYLNRHPGSVNSKKGPLTKPPYHVHPEYEDAKKKVDDARYHIHAGKGIVKTLKKAFEDEVESLKLTKEQARKVYHHVYNQTGHLYKLREHTDKKIKLLEDRIKKLEKP